MLKIRLKSHFGHVSVIAVYAPTNEAGNEEETKKFYRALQDCVRKTPKRDMLLVMGDFNARVGNDTNAWRGTIGRFGPEELNQNGVKLLDFCAFNNLVVTNTLFQHRPCHQQTLFHPADSTGLGHMPDYVLVNHCFRSSVLDTRVYRKTYLQSDHCFVVSRVCLKLKAKRRRSQQEPRYQTERRLLKEDHVQEFVRVMEEGLESCSTGSIEHSWREFKYTINEAQMLPLVPEKDERDWVTEKVREASRMKQETWMKWAKKPGDTLLKVRYQH